MAAPLDKVSRILDMFNNYHDRLKFTIEYEDNHCINFLDLSLLIIDNKIQIDWFHKKTFSADIFRSSPVIHYATKSALYITWTEFSCFLIQDFTKKT